MNRQQRMALMVGLAVFVGAFVYPPWTLVNSRTGRVIGVRWGFLFWPPDYSSFYFSLLIAEWFVVAAITGVGMVLCGERKAPAVSPPKKAGIPYDALIGFFLGITVVCVVVLLLAGVSRLFMR